MVFPFKKRSIDDLEEPVTPMPRGSFQIKRLQLVLTILDANLEIRLRFVGISALEQVLLGALHHHPFGPSFLLSWLLLHSSRAIEGYGILAFRRSFTFPGFQFERAVSFGHSHGQFAKRALTLGMEGDDHALNRLVLVKDLAVDGIVPTTLGARRAAKSGRQD